MVSKKIVKDEIEIKDAPVASAVEKPKKAAKPRKPKGAVDSIKMPEVYCTKGPTEEEIEKGNPEVEEELEAVGEGDDEIIEESAPEKAAVPEVFAGEEGEEVEWAPKTKLGMMVKNGEMTLEELFESGQVIREPEIIDILFPGIAENTILIGGSPGKGGGIQRRPSRRTVRVHKSGRRTSVSMMTIVGDPRGYVGIGVGKASSNKAAREKSLRNAKLNMFPVKKGCGSWECSCGQGHSIPFTTYGKSGSVEVKLMPAPKGLGLCVTDEMKKLFEIAGIKDVRIKTRGKTHSRTNFIQAIEDALKNANQMKQ
ncbi:MAG: 30S ribosomal protein S5 [Candidatus Aenigmarchaeota archaeon]|nr:30S ribosomal protein S5 [Candidatus Aenigmarchaeota archaeon]